MNELDLTIILCLAAHKMNASEVGRVMFMHRNGVVYHINKIKRITGLNPADFYDLCKLVQMAKERGEGE